MTNNFYNTVNEICKRNGTTATTVLREIGASTGNVSKWKNGSIPNIDLALRIAEHLDITLDYLVTGIPDRQPLKLVENSELSASDQEWLFIVRQIPDDKQDMCKDFLRTHAVVPEKYMDVKKG